MRGALYGEERVPYVCGKVQGDQGWNIIINNKKDLDEFLVVGNPVEALFNIITFGLVS